LQSLGGGAKGVDGVGFLGREVPPQLAECRIDDPRTMNTLTWPSALEKTGTS
jgi:hypothetical protein